MLNTNIAPKDEPPTTAKAILYTSSGEIHIEIWAREVPLAARNFLQHCIDGYYDNTVFHRIIPGFMIQGGDPSGTGLGGQSIYGDKFKDQFHQRLKFGRRGMVAMANSGKDSNGSQFFMTFGECMHLNKKHTIFGRIVGDSVYNLMSLQSLDTDNNDKPVDPPTIRKVKVMLNPFEDMVAKRKPETRQVQKKVKTNEIKQLRNKKRIQFDDDPDFPVEAQTNPDEYQIKSSHETLNDHRLSKQAAVTAENLLKKKIQKEEEEKRKKLITQKLNLSAGGQEYEDHTNKQQQGNTEKEHEHFGQQQINSIVQQQLIKKKNKCETSLVKDEVLNYHKVLNEKTGKIQIYWGDEIPEHLLTEQERRQLSEKQLRQESQKMQGLRQLQDREYEAIKSDELSFKKMKEGTIKERRKQLVAEEKTLLSTVEKRKYQFLKKQQLQRTQGETFSKLQTFQNRLVSGGTKSWMNHKLAFHIDSQNAYDLGKKNQQRKGRAEEDDGGLVIQYG